MSGRPEGYRAVTARRGCQLTYYIELSRVGGSDGIFVGGHSKLVHLHPSLDHGLDAVWGGPAGGAGRSVRNNNKFF